MLSDLRNMLSDSRKDDLESAIAVIVLLLGTATGNSYAMLGVSVAAIILLVVFRRNRIGSGGLVVALVAAVTAAVIGAVMAMQ